MTCSQRQKKERIVADKRERKHPFIRDLLTVLEKHDYEPLGYSVYFWS